MPFLAGPFTHRISHGKKPAGQEPQSQEMDRTEKQSGADLPPYAANNLAQLERGLSLNNNPNPQLFVVQDDRPPPGNGDGSESDSGGARTLLGEETYPEGGRVAWMVVFGCWCK